MFSVVRFNRLTFEGFHELVKFIVDSEYVFVRNTLTIAAFVAVFYLLFGCKQILWHIGYNDFIVSFQ